MMTVFIGWNCPSMSLGIFQILFNETISFIMRKTYALSF
jgi:hypothetical protein